MMPDKIYIGIQDLGSGYATDVSITPEEGLSEYIRKDALLKWAKYVLKCQEEELAKYDGPSYMRASTMGRIDAYKVVIAKLNSM